MQLQFDTISGTKRDMYKRKPALDYFNCKIKKSNLFVSFYFPLNIRSPRLANLIFPNSVYIKENPNDDNSIFELNQNKRYFTEGHWQSYNYLTKFENELREDLEFDLLINDDIKRQEEIIEKCQSVSIHFRRKEYSRFVDLSFYYNAVSEIRSKITEPKFFIFTDDPNWVKTNFVYNNNDTSLIITKNEIFDFYLMTKCKHHIISNSTFAWWASWLCKTKNKIIIAPPPVNWPDRNVLYPGLTII